MCQHNKKGKVFCVTQECMHNVSYGCMQCIRKYHKLGLKQTLIQQQQLLSYMKIYHVPTQIKQERKNTIYKVYNTLNTIKNQIYDHIDAHFNSILSKIKYPFLYHEDILDIYRLVRDKNYHKMNHDKLVHFYKTSKTLKNQEFISRQIKYYQEYLEQTEHSFNQLASQLKKIQSIFSFTVSQESYKLHLNAISQLSAKKPTSPQSNHFASSKIKQNNIFEKQMKPEEPNGSFLFNPKKKQKKQQFLTPKKQQNLDISIQQPSILSNENLQVRPRVNTLLIQYPSRQLAKESSLKQGPLEYSYNQSNFDNIFIKITEASTSKVQQAILKEISFPKISQSKVQKQKQSTQLREENGRNMFNQFKRTYEVVNKQKKEETTKSTLEAKPSFFLATPPSNHKRKTSINEMDFSCDSLGKDIFQFSREEKSKLIGGNIKKEIPFSQAAKGVKTQPVPKNKSLIGEVINDKQRQVEIGAIFLSGINQPLAENKIYFLQKYIEKYDNNITAVEYLTFLYLQKQKFKQCSSLSTKYLQKLKQCGADNRTKMNLIVNKAAALNNLGRYSETIKLLQESLKFGQSDRMHKNIGDAYYSINMLEKATYHYQKAIKSNNSFDQAYYNLAVILYRQDNLFNAKMNIEKALRINNSQQTYHQLKIHIQQKILMNDDKQI